MKCIDCNKDANMVLNSGNGNQLNYAFCKRCIKKRFRKLRLLGNAFYIDDLNDKYFIKDKQTKQENKT